jgi:hypothetical protein
MLAGLKCPNGHVVNLRCTLGDGDLLPCEQCGPDEFIRIKLTMETHLNSKGLGTSCDTLEKL